MDFKCRLDDSALLEVRVAAKLHKLDFMRSHEYQRARSCSSTPGKESAAVLRISVAAHSHHTQHRPLHVPCNDCMCHPFIEAAMEPCNHCMLPLSFHLSMVFGDEKSCRWTC
eukprot:4144840-Amphidinium_carterae.1